MRGPEALAAEESPEPGLTAALGASWGPQAAMIEAYVIPSIVPTP